MDGLTMSIIKEEDEDMDGSWSIDYLDTPEMEDTYEPVEFPANFHYFGGSMASEALVGCSGLPSRLAERSDSLTCGPVIGLGRNRQTVLSSQNKADFTALELEMGHSKFHGENSSKKRRIEPWCFPVTVMGILVLLIIFIPLFNSDDKAGGAARRKMNQLCNSPCGLTLVETLEPASVNRALNNGPSISALTLIQSAQFSLDIVAPFSHFRAPSAGLLQELREAAARNVKVRIVQPFQPPRSRPRFDPWSGFLSSTSVRQLNVLRFLPEIPSHGADLAFGVHFVIVDKIHFYFGHLTTPNDHPGIWRQPALVGLNCSCLAEDLNKLFSSYFYLAGLPTTQHAAEPRINFPAPSVTLFNASYPLLLPNSDPQLPPSSAFFAASPSLLQEAGRSSYIESVLTFIEGARTYLHIHVGDYAPVLSQNKEPTYWSVIDNAIRQAIIGRRVKAKLLVNKHTINQWSLLQSLTALNPILHQPIEIRSLTWPPAKFDNVTVAILSETESDDGMNYIVGDNGVHFGTNSFKGEPMLLTLGLSATILGPKRDSVPGDESWIIGSKDTQNQEESSSRIINQFNDFFEKRWSVAMDVPSDSMRSD